MTSPSTPEAAAARGALRLTRGVTATWWYTITAILFFEAMLVAVWPATLRVSGFAPFPIAVVGIGGAIWWLSTVPLMLDYRHRLDSEPLARWRRVLGPLGIAAVVGAAAALATGIWVLAFLPILQSIVLLNWQPGVRARVVLTATALLIALWFVDARVTLTENGAFDGDTTWWFLSLYSTLMPAMTVFSLWWWDVLIALDRARASEARLAATQERLRVATDVHDLQGHHLQVIALQLELAERLLSRDPDAAAEQLRAARVSVDEARQGTRDLALRFRSVPLRDELANAADLLRAAGTTVEVSVDRDAESAPGEVLGPVVRETTTNVLKHGGGRWARLALLRDGASWRYEIANDVVAGVAPGGDASAGAGDEEGAGAGAMPHAGGGAGLDGLRRRAADARGALDVRPGADEFVVTMTVPAVDAAADPRPAAGSRATADPHATSDPHATEGRIR